jgi:hypothetical protein
MVEPQQFENVDVSPRHSPDADACPLLRQLGDLLAFNWHWRALDLLWNFESDNGIRARPVLIAVLLQELSSNNTVPRALAQ